MSQTQENDLQQNLRWLLTPTFLMCNPVYYEPEGDANHFLTTDGFDRGEALDQWEVLKGTLQGNGARILEVTPHPDMKDQIYMADPSLTVVDIDLKKKDKPDIKVTTLMSKFHNATRVPEANEQRKLIESYHQMIKVKFGDTANVISTIKDSEHDFEGTGDCVYDPKTDSFYAGSRPTKESHPSEGRSVREAHRDLEDLTGIKVRSHTVQDPFFHIDVSFAPLQHHNIRHSLGHIADDPDVRGVEHIEVDRESADKFALNMVAFGENTVVIPSGTPVTEKLKELGYNVLPVDMTQAIKAGGAAHCSVNQIVFRVKGGTLKNPDYFEELIAKCA